MFFTNIPPGYCWLWLFLRCNGERKLQRIFILKNLPMEHISLNGLGPKQRQDNVFRGCQTLTSPDSDPDCQSLSYLQISVSMKCIPYDPGNSSAKCDEKFGWQNVRVTFVLLLSLFAATYFCLQYVFQSPIEFVWVPFPVCLLSIPFFGRSLRKKTFFSKRESIRMRVGPLRVGTSMCLRSRFYGVDDPTASDDWGAQLPSTCD